ncbi:sugar ABC transporter substrate-binding protein, partial [Klebsiella oxytoca]
MTACVVVNGYSGHKQEANDFARYLTSQNVDVLYDRTGKVSAARDVDYEFEGLKEFAAEYEQSISM